MKIIKQNDEAGGLIFKQNTAGKAMKQNYNFARWLESKTIDTAILNIEQYWKDVSVLMWLRAKGGNSTNLNMCDSPLIGVAGGAKRLYVNGGVWVYNDPLAGSYVTDKGLYYCDGKTNVHKCDGYSSAFQNPFSVAPTSQKLIFKISVYGGYHRIVIFNRSLSKDEVVYFFNNRLGNEILNVSGVVSDFNFGSQNFTQVKVSGIDYAGIEDTVSGFHAYLTNMPAGTITDKINYANLNFLKT